MMQGQSCGRSGDLAQTVSGGVTNIVLAGVGGQGSVLATRILARAAELAGHDVVTAEVHGMSQRGGTVVTTVRFGPQVLSPAIPKGEAGFLVAFERLEGARNLDMLRAGGVALVNDQRIAPSMEAIRHAGYPSTDDLHHRARSRDVRLLLFPALQLARELGNDRLSSTVMLGALSSHLQIDRRHWLAAVRESVPPKTIKDNEAALAAGMEKVEVG